MSKVLLPIRSIREAVLSLLVIAPLLIFTIGCSSPDGYQVVFSDVAEVEAYEANRGMVPIPDSLRALLVYNVEFIGSDNGFAYNATYIVGYAGSDSIVCMGATWFTRLEDFWSAPAQYAPQLYDPINPNLTFEDAYELTHTIRDDLVEQYGEPFTETRLPKDTPASELRLGYRQDLEAFGWKLGPHLVILLELEKTKDDTYVINIRSI